MSFSTRNNFVNGRSEDVIDLLYGAKYNLACLAEEAGEFEEARAMFSEIPWRNAIIEKRQVGISHFLHHQSFQIKWQANIKEILKQIINAE